jgi:SAM-dependent methyltransferase
MRSKSGEEYLEVLVAVAAAPNVRSPLTGSSNVTRVDVARSGIIVARYREDLGIDVSHYFEGMDEVPIYRCEDSGYRFFHPPSIAGRSDLYEQLQEHQPYYAVWRWDHGEACRFVPSSRCKVLELGAGRGTFIEHLKDAGHDVCGLELNPKVAEQCRAKGLEVYTETVEEHAASHAAAYDVICSFQVMEHVCDVAGFIASSLQALRPGGRLIASVPNNIPYLFRYDKYNTLNLPPHHMGLWDEASLRRLPKFFEMAVLAVVTEPLHPHQVDYYWQVGRRHGPESPGAHSGVVGRLRLWHLRREVRRERIHGRNLLAVFEKRGAATTADRAARE